MESNISDELQDMPTTASSVHELGVKDHAYLDTPTTHIYIRNDKSNNDDTDNSATKKSYEMNVNNNIDLPGDQEGGSLIEPLNTDNIIKSELIPNDTNNNDLKLLSTMNTLSGGKAKPKSKAKAKAKSRSKSKSKMNSTTSTGNVKRKGSRRRSKKKNI